MTGFLPILLVIALMTLSGAALSRALVATRGIRLDHERRLTLVRRLPVPREAAREIAPGHTLDARVRRFFGYGLEHDWGIESSAATLLALALAAGAASALVLVAVLHLSPLVAAPPALAAAYAAPRALMRRRQNAAERLFLELLPDAVDMVVRMLRAGLPITTAIHVVGSEAQHPVDTVFAGLSNQIAVGIRFEDAVALAGDRIGIADFRFFTAAVSLQHATGGNLAATLESLSDIIRRRRGARAKAQSATAEVRLSALVLGALPFIVTLLLLVANPRYLAPLIADSRGRTMIGVAIGLLLLGFATMRRMMRSIERI